MSSSQISLLDIGNNQSMGGVLLCVCRASNLVFLAQYGYLGAFWTAAAIVICCAWSSSFLME